MMDIAITYPFLLFKRKASGKVPTCWEELTERQFIAISRTIHGAEPDFRFLSVLTGIDQSLLKKLHPFDLLKLAEGIEFVGKAGNSHFEFIIREIAGTDFVCPKPKLAAMTFGQFIFSDAYYNDWMATQKETALNNFVASLYLLPGAIFNSETIPDRVWTIVNIDLDIRKAIAFNYGLIMVWLQKCYPLIFQPSTEPVIANEAKQSVRTQQSGWLKLFESLVGEDLINRDRYADLPVHTVFRHLTTKYKDNARKG